MPWDAEQVLALAPDFALAAVAPLARAGEWFVRDDDAWQVPLELAETGAWTLMALSGGHPLAMAGEWNGERFRPLSVWTEGRFLRLWAIQWQPEFAVALIEAGVWGNTIPGAAAAKARHDADAASDLPAVTALLDATLLADLPEAAAHLLSRLQAIAAVASDVGHLATSVVYAGVFSAVLASLPSVNTRMVVFDTAVVDLSDQLADPVDVLFGTQLGGGTDINQALSYCQGLVRQPQDTILVLISDLYEGGDSKEMLKRVATLVASGVQIIGLLALNDDGAPLFDQNHAAAFAALGIPTFACSPDLFPELMAAAIQRQDLQRWAALQGLNAARAKG
jgi:hypothetical protein